MAKWLDWLLNLWPWRAPKPPMPISGDTLEQLFALHNRERVERGREPLRVDDRLAAAAQAHAAWMARMGTLSHAGLEQRLAQAGYYHAGAAENVAQGQSTAADVMATWLLSPGHRNNLLGYTYTDVGFGVAQGNGGPYWCAIFANHAAS